MKTLLLSFAVCLLLIQTNTAYTQPNPCPCDCEDILYSPTMEKNNCLHIVKSRTNENCYTLDLQLNACGDRTLMGFSIAFPSPNCFEGKNIQITMDGVDMGIVDLGNTAIPPVFSLDPPLLPCTSRNISFRICFPDGDGSECLTSPTGGLNSYNVDVNYQFAPNDPPCETQTVTAQFDMIPDIGTGVDDYKVGELFNLENNVLKLKNTFQATSIYIFDVEGRNIMVSRNNIVDMSGLKIGTYLILIEDGNKHIRTTYIKQN